VNTVVYNVVSTLILQYRSDPHGTRVDAELVSILQRAWLLPKDGAPDPAMDAKFSLDSPVGDEGMLTV
jgi:ATP-binding cassette subfamily C (CFTR/MRP) protein 1